MLLRLFGTALHRFAPCVPVVLTRALFASLFHEPPRRFRLVPEAPRGLPGPPGV